MIISRSIELHVSMAFPRSRTDEHEGILTFVSAQPGSANEVSTDSTVRTAARQRRSQATFDAILTAAGALFDEVGVEATTMDAVARRARVSIGAVYRFFENRDALVATLALRCRERIQQAALPQFSDESLQRDADAVISDFLVAFRRVLDGVPGARGLLSTAFTHPTVQEHLLWTAHVERFIERYAPGLRAARRRQAAHTYQAVTTTLMASAASPGQRTSAQLKETRSVLLGYTNQLALEAAANA
jgi:AcrR family transcriptional regulator